MTELSVEELDLLERIAVRQDSARLFFQRVKGLKWFDELEVRKYFESVNNPRPQETTDDGHVMVPYWDVLDYLEKTSPELLKVENERYSQKFREILISTTKYAKEKQFSNYRTWWKFAQIIANIPSKDISLEDLEIVNYWLDDPYDNVLVAECIGSHWLPKLIKQYDQHSRELATELFSMLFEVSCSTERTSPLDRSAVQTRVELSLGRTIANQLSRDMGHQMGDSVLPIFESRIKCVLRKLNRDRSSVIWRPAIEDHEQNEFHDQPINLLIDVYRDVLLSYVSTKVLDGVDYVSKMLSCEYVTIQRVAIHAIGVNFSFCRQLFSRLLKPSFWMERYKHELWTLLSHNYPDLNEKEKESVLDAIGSFISTEDDLGPQSRAYQRAEWLAALKDHGKEEENLYLQNSELAGAQPEHPSFSSFMQSGWIKPKSPIAVDEMGSMEIADLIQYLEDFKEDRSVFFESQIEGLFDTFRQFIKTSALSFSQNLTLFDTLDLKYVFQITEAFIETWEEKAALPWDDIWDHLLQFCGRLVSNDEFWSEENAESRGAMIPNRHWVVGSIATLIVSGVKSDDHAFEPRFLDSGEKTIATMLNNQLGDSFEGNDSVFNAINSPRGKCIQALINLTLRKCRIKDAANEKVHDEVWEHFRPLYTQELERTRSPSYEVPTLFANYLPNLLYMSKDWTVENLDRIFSKHDDKWWRCAMEGYAYVDRPIDEIYLYLRDKGHLIRVLDDDVVHQVAKDQAIENICVAYFRGIDSLEEDSSALRSLISRNKPDELKTAIVDIWRTGKSSDEFVPQVIAFWRNVLNKIDLESQDGQMVASCLCMLAESMQELDDSKLELICAVAPYADIEHNSYSMFQWLESISESQPSEAYSIWKSMLSISRPAYPENSLKSILTNILKQEREGIAQAYDIVEIYLKGGNGSPHAWLSEIQNTLGQANPNT